MTGPPTPDPPARARGPSAQDERGAARAGFVYLHGFASGPGSKKAQVFRERLAARGVALEVPDLNEGPGGFRALTVTRMIGTTLEAARRAREAAGLGAGAPLVLIGSSLGGYVAALVAAREPSVAASVLMAPAFEFGPRLAARLAADGEGESARARGAFEVFDHGRGANAWIDYGIVTDALRHEAFPDVRCPTLVAQGRRDDVVTMDLAEEFARGRPNVSLVIYEDEHQLLGSAEAIWRECERFLAPWLPPA